MLPLLALLAQQPADDGAVLIRLGGSVLPASAAATAPALPPGPRVSLEFQEADIHSVLRVLSTASGVNIVAGDDVKGTVTVRLIDVPYADALTVIQASEGGAPAREVTFTDDMGGSFSGTLCGNVLSWSGGGTGYTESGTWVFDSADHFVKATAYDDTANATRGCCTGEGTRQGATAPTVPAMCPATSCAAP